MVTCTKAGNSIASRARMPAAQTAVRELPVLRQFSSWPSQPTPCRAKRAGHKCRAEQDGEATKSGCYAIEKAF